MWIKTRERRRTREQKRVNLPGDLLALSIDVGPHDAGLRQVCRNLLNLRQVYPAGKPDELK
jgi:hypothetical protein